MGGKGQIKTFCVSVAPKNESSESFTNRIFKWQLFKNACVILSIKNIIDWQNLNPEQVFFRQNHN